MRAPQDPLERLVCRKRRELGAERGVSLFKRGKKEVWNLPERRKQCKNVRHFRIHKGINVMVRLSFMLKKQFGTKYVYSKCLRF